MKTFQELKDILEDYRDGWGIGIPEYGLGDAGAMYLGNPEQLARLNGFIESHMGRNFIDVRHAFTTMHQKLMMVGLDFEMEGINADEGTYSIPITQYGGAFGTTPEHNLMKDGFYRDDGPSDGNFALEATVAGAEAGGGYTISAKIVSK